MIASQVEKRVLLLVRTSTSNESDQIRPRECENHELHPSLDALLTQEPLDRFNVTTDARHMKSVVTFLN
jgi:hypothetical protein